MKKRIFMILFFALFTCSRPAYAIFDVAAAIETFMEIKTEIENKVQEIQKYYEDMQKKLKQGFAMGASCFQNPMDCNPDALMATLNGLAGTVKNVQPYKEMVFTMPNSVMNEPGALAQKSQEELLNDITKNYIYTAGQGDDINKTIENRKAISGVVANETALLFAKGITTRHSIRSEKDDDLYPNDLQASGDDPGNIDKVLNAEGMVLLLSASRIARILELKAGMISSEATSELTQQSNSGEEN